MAQVCWISGNLAERKLVLEKIKNQFSGFDVQVFSSEYQYYYVEKEINSSSCFSEKRLIIIESMPTHDVKQKQTMVNRFKKLLNNLPEDVFIVFYDIELEDEKALSNHVEKIGKVYNFPSVLDTRSAPQWVVSKFYSYDKIISEEDADFLVRTSGFDKDKKGIGIDVLSLAIKKICLYIGNRKKNITRDDLINTAFDSQEFIIWELSTAFDSKNIEKCYEVIEKIKIENEHLKSAAETIYAISLWRYRMLFYMKEEQAKRPGTNVGLHFSSIPKLAQSGHGWKMKMVIDFNLDGTQKMAYSSYSIKEAIEGQFSRKPILSYYTRKELRRILEVLEEGFKDVRLCSDDNRDRGALLLLLDSLVFTVCNVVDDPEIIKSMRMLNG